jgi:Caspase domain
MCCVLLICLAQNCNAQSTRAVFGEGFTDEGMSPLLQYQSKRRLRVEVQPVEGGLKVLEIHDNSPVERLQSPANRQLVASMEVNDVITSINGKRVRTGDELSNELQNVGDECEVEVLDIRTNQPITWIVKPVWTHTPVMTMAAYTSSKPKIHVIIAAATNDSLLREAIDLSVASLKRTLTGSVDPTSINIQLVEGANCNAFGIASAIKGLQVGFKDGILLYYLGHGAYDPSLVDKDPYGGQFFDFPGTDLLRRAVWSHLDAKPVRLKLLISDSCNNSSHASMKEKLVVGAAPYAGVDVKGTTNLEWLLLGHAGTLDINAASRDEFAWYSNDYGGWFTQSLIPVVSRHSAWSQVVATLPVEANQTFQRNKRRFLGIPATTATVPVELLNRQPRLTPMIFSELERDEIPPFPDGVERRFPQPELGHPF